MRDTEKDFFRDDELVSDPCLYLAALRNRCPVRREPPTSESPRTSTVPRKIATTGTSRRSSCAA